MFPKVPTLPVRSNTSEFDIIDKSNCVSSSTARRAGGVPQVAGVVPGDGRPGAVPAGEELPQGDAGGLPRAAGRRHLGGGGRSGQGVFTAGEFVLFTYIQPVFYLSNSSRQCFNVIIAKKYI